MRKCGGLSQVVTHFLRLEEVLDNSVNNTVALTIDRGGVSLSIQLTVQDLHSISPNFFLELSGGVLHPLSYQQARNFRFRCGLVYVATPGFMLSIAGVPKHAIIKKLNQEETPTIEAFLQAYQKLTAGDRVPVEFHTHGDRHRTKVVLATVDRLEWYSPPAIRTRDDSTGLWHKQLALANASAPPVLSGSKRTTREGEGEGKREGEGGGEGEEGKGKRSRTEEEEQNNGMANGTSEAPPTRQVAVQGQVAGDSGAQLADDVVGLSLVQLEVQVPESCMMDGLTTSQYAGTALVVHHSVTQGLGVLVVDRNTVPSSLADIRISFAAYPVEVPGEVSV